MRNAAEKFPEHSKAVLQLEINRNGPLSVSIVERYTSDRKINRLFEESTSRTATLAGFTTVDDNSVGAVYTTDLTVGWQAPQVD